MSPRRVNGEGSIWRRKDGRWVAATYARTNEGTEKRVHLYGGTHAEVREKLTALMRELDQGATVPVQNPTVAEYLRHWLADVVRPGRAPKTYQGYELAVRRYLEPALGRRQLRRLTVADVRRLLDQLVARGLGPRMVQFVHAVLRNALENAVREELLARNVARLVQMRSPRYEVGRGLSVAQARALLQAARGDRFAALYVLAVYLGLRRGELLGLRWRDVDLDKGRLEVVQTLQRVDGELRFLPPKTRHSRRTIPLPPPCMEALVQHRRRQARERLAAGSDWREQGLVFATTVGTPFEPDNLRRSWSRIRAVTGDPPARFHDLRHTCVTLLLEAGVPPHVVREIVGHSAIDVTMTIYAHASLDEKRRALERLGDQLL
jgi:integrase